jgi:hypothetical protein
VSSRIVEHELMTNTHNARDYLNSTRWISEYEDSFHIRRDWVYFILILILILILIVAGALVMILTSVALGAYVAPLTTVTIHQTPVTAIAFSALTVLFKTITIGALRPIVRYGTVGLIHIPFSAWVYPPPDRTIAVKGRYR